MPHDETCKADIGDTRYVKVFCGAEIWTLRKADQKYLENTEMRCWRRMEIIWTDRLRNQEVFHTVKEERNILHTIKRNKAN